MSFMERFRSGRGNPGNTNPGNTRPGNPGNTTPGNTNPGNMNSENMDLGNERAGNDSGMDSLEQMAGQFNLEAAQQAQAARQAEMANYPNGVRVVEARGRRGRPGETVAERMERQQENILEAGVLGNEAKERAFIDRIAGNWNNSNGSYEKVMDTLYDERERKILAYMTLGRNDVPEQMNPANIFKFVSDYPSPMDFDEKASDFLDRIEQGNGPAKRRQYEDAMSNFKQHVYGKKEEYWEALKDLRVQAKMLEEDTVDLDQVMRMVPQDGSQVMERNLGARNYQVAEQKPPALERDLGIGEWLVGHAGKQQLSRQQVKMGLANKKALRKGLEDDGSSEDAELTREDLGFFGVFDGVGGAAGGRRASHLAAQEANRLCDKKPLESSEDLRDLLNKVSQAVAEDAQSGYTTGTIARILKKSNGKTELIYASAGDTRLYIVSENGETEMVTKDEGEGRILRNGLGFGGIKGSGSRVVQHGRRTLNKGDKIVLCSDGITGDKGTDLMSEAELGSVVRGARNADEAAKSLVIKARKKDDRTALVFQGA